MKTSDRNRQYSRIRTLEDLHYQKRILSSKIDHQEVMIMYRFRNLWDFMSPGRLAVLGLESLASHNKTFGIFYRIASFVTGFIRKSRMKQ
ncbi:MAG: hypothetical protein KBS57_05210 [Alistipes sp.]|nr:hypothetical protein [Candidatus Minthomonas equi]